MWQTKKKKKSKQEKKEFDSLKMTNLNDNYYYCVIQKNLNFQKRKFNFHCKIRIFYSGNFPRKLLFLGNFLHFFFPNHPSFYSNSEKTNVKNVHKKRWPGLTDQFHQVLKFERRTKNPNKKSKNLPFTHSLLI